ncbi:MAG: tetratricopeptide repeat protein, partial [Caldilineaceae bacterium]|nr:tetratricopeptide repeat protein [Caldilineaceae bacterium]
ALSSLHMNSSVALFIQTGQRVDHTFALTAENQRSVVAICRHLHGLPLALELAATGLAQMSSQALADALIQSANQSSERDSTAKVVSTKGENPLDLLQTSMRNMPVRHRAITNVFAYSWELLSDSEQQAAMQFALFRGGADRGALVAITCKAQSTLTELVHKSLVQRDGDGRFAMHELLRQFCLEQLDRSADPTLVTNTRQRHATYYLQSLHESELTIRGHDPQPLLTQLQRDLDNLRQAWQWALHNGYWSLIDQSLSGLSRFYLLLGLLSEARHTMREAAGVLSTVPVEQRMIAQEGISPEQLLARLLVTDAFFSNALADYDAAVTVAQEVIAAPTSSHDGMISATAHLRWGEALWYKGEIETAQPHLTQALALVEDHISSGQQWQPEIKADALCVLGLIAVRKGDYSAATVAYGESHRLSESLGDAYRSGRALYSLGTVYRNQAHYAEARRYLALGLTIARQTGDRHSESRVLNSLGDIELYQGNFRKAREYYLHVADFAAVVGDRRSECIAQTNLGIVARDLGQYGIAIENFNESLTLARTIGFPRGEGWTLCCLSLLHHQQGRHREALRFAREALVLFDHLGDRLG